MRKIVYSRAEYDWWYFKVLEIQQDRKKGLVFASLDEKIGEENGKSG